MHYEVENDTLQKELDQISKNNEHLQVSKCYNKLHGLVV